LADDAPMRRKLSPTKLALLRRVPAFRYCSDKELGRLAPFVDEAEVAAGTVLAREGGAAREAFVIIDGWAAVNVCGATVATLGPGQIAGETAMLDPGPRTATVVATTPMKLLVVGPRAFGDFASQPAVARGIASELAERLRKADSRISV
jgi:CRP-like cAMP-binding protein